MITDALHRMFRRNDGKCVNAGESERKELPLKLRLAPTSTLNTPYDMFANIESMNVDDPLDRIAELFQLQENSCTSLKRV